MDETENWLDASLDGVLSECVNDGLTLENNLTEVANRIVRSRWFALIKEQAKLGWI